MVYALQKRWEAEQERQDFRAGMVTSAIYNTIRDHKKRRKPYEPQDFMPERASRKPKEMTAEQSLDYIALLNASMGGADLRQKVTA